MQMVFSESIHPIASLISMHWVWGRNKLRISEEDPSKNMADIFLERWTGKRPVKMIHPELASILGPTKGIIVYQEQIMRIVHELGGLTMPETNKLRKSISKKEGD